MGQAALDLTQEQQLLYDRLSDQKYRLNHLYKIADKSGRIIPYQMNWEQGRLYEEMHYLNLIVKPRQIGASTFIDIFSLDRGHFNSNQEFVLIAHKLDDGKKIFETKILDPFNNMPDGIRLQATTDSKTELGLENGSSFRIGTSARSGTAQVLHISEFGYICAYTPKKADEIVTGALNAVDQGEIVFIESTAKGRIGYFYDYCQEAYKLMLSMRKLTSMDWKLFFFPWWAHPEYCMSAEETKLIVLTRDDLEYFEDLAAKHKIQLSDRQKAWYVQKQKKMRNPEAMGSEFPSHFDEAFRVSTEGAYYAKEIRSMYADGRIGCFPFDPRNLVHTFWDLGHDDANSIIFAQKNGPWYDCIDYYEKEGEGLPHFVQYLQELAAKKGYIYGKHFGPHDIEQFEYAAGAKRNETAKKLGISFITIPRIKYDIEGVTAARAIFPLVRIDESNCAQLILCLENFRKAWDEKNQVFTEHYVHDKHSHGAKAFETFAFGTDIGLGSGASSMTPAKAKALADKYNPMGRRR